MFVHCEPRCELLPGLHTREEDLCAGAGINWNSGSPDCSPAAEAWARQDWGAFAVHCPGYQNKIITVSIYYIYIIVY